MTEGELHSYSALNGVCNVLVTAFSILHVLYASLQS